MQTLNRISILTTVVFGLAMAPMLASASEITLTLKDRNGVIAGEFAGFKQNAYIVETVSGLINVPAKFVDCEGDACLIIVSSNDQD